MPAPTKRTAKKLSLLRELLAAGASMGEIGRQLGVPRQTATRWAAEQAARGTPNPAKAPAPELPSELPPGLSAAETPAFIEDMIRRGGIALAAAEEEGEHAAISSLNARLQGWIDRRQRFAPAATQDPAEAPDFVAAGERAAARMLAMVEAIERGDGRT